MRTSARNALVLAGSLAVLGGGLALLARSRRPAEAAPLPSAAAASLPVPDGALLVLSIDLRALRDSPLAAALRGPKNGVTGDVQALCGFDPMDTLEHLVVSLPRPKGERDDDFGAAATGGRIEAEEIARCATRVVAGRGGRPRVDRLGDFAIVRDDARGLDGGEIAVRNGGPLLIGKGDYLRAMIAVAQGSAPNAGGGVEHVELMKSVEQRALKLTFVITDKQRADFAERASEREQSSVLLFARSATLGVDVGPFVTAHASVQCDSEKGAIAIAKLAREVRDKKADSLTMRLAGLHTVLRKLDVEPIGKSVHAHLSLPTTEVVKLVDRLLGLGGGDLDPKEPPPAKAPELEPDLVLSAAPRASAAPSASAKKREDKK